MRIKKKKKKIVRSISDKNNILKISSTTKLNLQQKANCQINFAAKMRSSGLIWEKNQNLKSILLQKSYLQVKLHDKNKICKLALRQKGYFLKSNLRHKSNCRINFAKNKTQIFRPNLWQNENFQINFAPHKQTNKQTKKIKIRILTKNRFSRKICDKNKLSN